MRTVALLALAILLSGCAAGGDQRQGAVDLAPGGFKEFKVAMGKGDTLSWRWSTGGEAVGFDAHTHKDGGSQTLREETAAAGEGTLTAPEAGSYYLFWQNGGNGTVGMTYFVQTDGEVVAEYQ